MKKNTKLALIRWGSIFAGTISIGRACVNFDKADYYLFGWYIMMAVVFVVLIRKSLDEFDE